MSRLVSVILLSFCIMLIINPFLMLVITSYSLHAKLFCVQIKLENLSGPYIPERFKIWHLSIFVYYILCFYKCIWEMHMECFTVGSSGLPFHSFLNFMLFVTFCGKNINFFPKGLCGMSSQPFKNFYLLAMLSNCLAAATQQVRCIFCSAELTLCWHFRMC